MKTSYFHFFVFLLIFASCNDDDLSFKEDLSEDKQNIENLTQQIADFSRTDTEIYNKLLQDQNFLKLCSIYQSTKIKILADTTPTISKYKLSTDSIFSMTDSLIEKHTCCNVFNYVLKYLDNKPLSRAHDWGQCYYFSASTDPVCDTYQHWTDAWRKCGEFEYQADAYLDSRLDAVRYRQLQAMYLMGYAPYTVIYLETMVI